MQAPGPLAKAEPIDVEAARKIIEAALAEGRSVLSSAESKALLGVCGIPVNPIERAASADEAVRLAEQLGMPVVMKIDSPDITHKSDVGGVRLDLKSAKAVRGAWESMMADVAAAQPKARIAGATIEPMIQRADARELLLGMVQDTVFGPVMTFGAGGIAVEVLRDRAVALPPLNAMLIDNMVAKTRISKMLGEFRGAAAVDRAALESALLHLSEMACELPWIREVDINPLLADGQGVIAVDARVVVGPATANDRRDRYARLAIHPYPSDLTTQWPLADGTLVTMRPIRPEDAQIEMEFVRGLSAESRYFRFMDTMRELTPDLLARFTQIDYDREMAFVAIAGEPGSEVELAVGRYATNPDGESCEFAVVVGDTWHGRGLARRMMEALISVARRRGLRVMMGHIMASNDKMLKLAIALGFRIQPDSLDHSLRQAILDLQAPAA
jgi:acetyltransferase